MPNISGLGVSGLLSPRFFESGFILPRGEIAFEVDTRELKIGDGVTQWSSLDPVGGGSDPGGTTSSGPAAPTTGAWAKGDVFWNTEPSAGGNAGWVCVSSGTPGTWASFGTISV
jgi:Major tropism determinant N-terminal domain